MMFRVLIALLMIAPVASGAQPGARSGRDSIAIERMRARDRRQCGPKEGLMLPEFAGTTMDGRVFTLADLKQRVSLVTFWYPSCNCFRPDVLEPFEQFLSNPRFQIISIMPDSFNYTTFVREYTVPGAHVNLSSHEKCHELNMNSGFPSAMLVDGTGKVLKLTGAFHRFYIDEAEWAARIREALMF